MRFFIFVWKNNKKGSIERKSKITLPTSTGEIAIDAKRACDIFCKAFGNLTKNNIISIQEVDENGKHLGEPIKPVEKEEDVIIPTRRR